MWCRPDSVGHDTKQMTSAELKTVSDINQSCVWMKRQQQQQQLLTSCSVVKAFLEESHRVSRIQHLERCFGKKKIQGKTKSEGLEPPPPSSSLLFHCTLS